MHLLRCIQGPLCTPRTLCCVTHSRAADGKALYHGAFGASMQPDIMRKNGEQCEKYLTELSFRPESHQIIIGQLLSYAGAFHLPTMVFFGARATEGTSYYCALLDCKIPGLLLICITKWLGTGNDHPHCSTMPDAHVNSTLMVST